MVVVLVIAFWSLGNSVCLDAIGRIMNVAKDEDNREVLNAVVSEITVLGFIALLSGIASRSNFLNDLSPAVFGEPPSGGLHSLFLFRVVGRLFSLGEPALEVEDFLTEPAAAIERFPDIRDGRNLAELTVLFEDLHIGLFLIMMTLIGLALLNYAQVNLIVKQWEYAEELIQRHAPDDAFRMLHTLVQKHLEIGFHRRFRMRIYMMYISYREEFLNPSTGVSCDGVDSESFPFFEYLRRCAGAALVESVEVPLWMYAANGILVMCLRPFFSLGRSGSCDVHFFVIAPYLLLLPMLILALKLSMIMADMSVDPAKLLGTEEGESASRGRRFAIAERARPAQVRKAEAKTLLRALQQYTHGTLTPTPFERLFWFHRCGIRFLAVISRLVLFWTSVYIALFILVVVHYPFTWMQQYMTMAFIILPLILNIFVVYPYVTCLRILVTNTEYSPHRYAIRQLLRESSAEVDRAKQMLVAVFKREKMKGLVMKAKQSFENKEIKELEEKFARIPERTRHFIETAYYAFDTNNDGYLNREELQSCLKTLRMSGDLEDVALGLSASGLFRPSSDEWFQILAPDLRGVNHAQFKVLIWGLLNTSGLELNKDEIIQALTHLNRGEKKVNADAIQKIVLRLTRLQQGISQLGSTFMQEMYFFKKLEGMLPEGYEVTLDDFADLLISWDHEFSTQRGLE
jgi:Ca2+-binding EF-hand superfamily protein